MTREEFCKGVAEIRFAFDLPKVRDEVLSVWYRRGLSTIEQREWLSIIDRVIQTEPRFPMNFVLTISSYRAPKSEPKVYAPPEMTDEEIEENRREFNKIMSSIGRMG